MADLQKGTTFTDGVSIANAANLNNLMDLGQILPGFIADKTNVVSPSTGVELIINDGGTLKKVTLANLATVITGGAGGVIHGKTAVTALTALDEFLLWEDTVADERKITYGDLLNELEADLSKTDMGLPTILTGTTTFNPGAMAPGDNAEATITVTGAVTTNTPAVAVGFSIDYPDGMVVEQVRVSAANTVTVSLRNAGGGTQDLASHTIRAVVFQF